MSEEAFPEHTVETFLGHDLAELMKKRFVASLAVKAARQGMEEENPRAPRALAYYKEERRLINAAIQQKKHGDDGPPAQAVELKTLAGTGIAVSGSERASDTFGESFDIFGEFLKMWNKETGGTNG